MTKNLLKNRDDSWMQERKKELDALIEFVNAEIESIEGREIADLVYGCRLFEDDQVWMSFLFKSTTREPDPADLAKRKRSLIELQSHLKERIEKILSAIKTGIQTPILEITGKAVFTAHPLKDRFLLNLKEDKEADSLMKEKAKLNLRLLDLVRILGLKPRRFKECPECKRIFYQAGFKEKVYCSPKCSGAHRQKELQKRKSSPDSGSKKKEVIEAEKEVIDELKNQQSSMDGDSKT